MALVSVRTSLEEKTATSAFSAAAFSSALRLASWLPWPWPRTRPSSSPFSRLRLLLSLSAAAAPGHPQRRRPWRLRFVAASGFAVAATTVLQLPWLRLCLSLPSCRHGSAAAPPGLAARGLAAQSWLTGSNSAMPMMAGRETHREADERPARPVEADAPAEPTRRAPAAARRDNAA